MAPYPVVEKPQTDHREYGPLVLDNGLRVVLISDCKCDKAAAALSVGVGSLADPKDCQGLAHFLEHMLFLGTEKYPQEDEYNEFLAKHGGSSNAYTADAVTNFYFGVSPDHLEGALDRFSQFFISPLFSESATDREMQAVDSEHAKNQQSDSRRFHQLLRNDANPKHPLCHFGTGNLETLKVIPEREGILVRQRLLDFHKAHYSSNIMCLVVLGRESLADLEDLVRTKFGPIENRGLVVPSGPDVGGGEPPFLPETLPRLVRCLPVKDMRAVVFQFVLPQQLPMRWRTKPTRYLYFLVGHEGKGSLLSCLKAKGLATELVAGPAMDEAGVCVFEVTVMATEAGESQVKTIGECVFAYVRLMQQMPVSEALFRETQLVEEMNFRFRSTPNPISAVSSLSHAMQDGLPLEKVLSGPAKVWDLNVDEISEVAALLSCSRLRLVLANKALEKEDGACPETEHWYGTRHGAGPLPLEWHTAWEESRTGGPAGGGAEAARVAGEALGLALPLPNPFVAEDLELKPQPPGGVPKYPWCMQPLPPELSRALEVACPAAVGSPSRLLQLYFRQDDTFGLPKAHLNIQMYCPWSSEGLWNRVATAIWSSAAMEELNEYAYDAEVAGLFYQLSANSRGISLRLAGYQDKLPLLLRKVAEKMSSADEVSEHTWGLVRMVLLRDATNAATTKQPYMQASEWEQRCLVKTAITSQEWLDCLSGMTREDISGTATKLLSCCYAEALLQGNVAEAGVSEVLQALLPALPKEAAAPAQIPPLGAAPLPGGPRSCVLIRRAGSNASERNGAVLLTLQAAEETLENVTMSELVAQVLSQRCFDELRTKQQLGYIVALQAHADGIGTGSCGIKVIVQSEKHPAEVHRRIDGWLGGALTELHSESSDEQLGEYVESLLAVKREKPKKLADEFQRNWAQVGQRRFQFSRREEQVAFLERPKAELLPLFRTFVREKLVEAPRIASEILGAAAAALPTDSDEARPYEGATTILETLDDILAFRERLTWQLSNTAIVA
mmetsp:Transcript_48832/g.140380  ORF Transcript_48832/g.140380 Transcript_48832/m.140380 type:complete len:1013 (-) Transcript_48832:12-3050(-)